jgi:hypothetical protein
MLFAAVRESAYGTKLAINCVRFDVSFRRMTGHQAELI